MSETIETIPMDVLIRAYRYRTILRSFQDPEPEKLREPGSFGSSAERWIEGAVRIYNFLRDLTLPSLPPDPENALLGRLYGEEFVSWKQRQTEEAWLGYLPDPKPYEYSLDAARKGLRYASQRRTQRKYDYYNSGPVDVWGLME